MNEGTFFNCEDESIDGFAQEPSEFVCPGESYEMVQNKGVGKKS
jgi:hypothetical protein